MTQPPPAPSPDARSAPSQAEQSLSLYGHRSDGAGHDAPPRRPPELLAGAVFLTLAALPAGALGLLLAAQPGTVGENLRQELTNAGTTIAADTLVTLFRLAGGLLIVLAVAFVVLSWLALRPSRGARNSVVGLAVLEVLALVFAIVATAPDPASIALTALAAGGAILMVLPRSEEFLRAGR
ncbi:MAG TPA: hypothetical protein VGH99_10915 [Pseudonocardia sp.]